MASYTELNARPASDFLNPGLFRTDFDTDVDRRELRYGDELAKCKEYRAFHIGVNGTWSATTHCGGSVSSYEGIGYHAYTADLLRAVLDSDCAFIVHRIEDGKIVDYDVRAMQQFTKAMETAGEVTTV